MKPVYLDHAATSPLAPGVLDAMLPFLTGRFGNPSSVHARGRDARHAADTARDAIARSFGVDPGRIWITSGGSEANNTAVRGLAARREGAVVTCAAEHRAVLEPIRRLEREGREVIMLPPDGEGAVDPDAIRRVLDRAVAFVSVMAANNETGTLSPLADIADLCAGAGVPLHTDAVQLAAHADIRPESLGAALVSVSAHKIGGPVGIGALLLGPDADCEPLILGGSQERGRRAGTENVAALAGFAEAAVRAARLRGDESNRIRTLRDRLADALCAELADRISVTTPLERAAPHILHCTFPPVDGRRVDGEMLLLRLDLEGVQASAGSACTSGALEPSHVLLAMGRSRDEASASLRLSVGHTTTPDDIDRAIPAIVRTVRGVTA